MFFKKKKQHNTVKYFTEFFGTFTLVTVAGLTGNPIAIGFTLMALIYMGFDLSGAIYNPAITLAAVTLKKISFEQAWRYIGCQLAGCMTAALVILMLNNSFFSPIPRLQRGLLLPLMVELLFTFILTYVVFHTSSSKKLQNDMSFALAVGALVVGILLAGGSFSGAVYNPAITLGPFLVNIGQLVPNMSVIGWYILAQTSGALLAGFAFALATKK